MDGKWRWWSLYEVVEVEVEKNKPVSGGGGMGEVGLYVDGS